MVPWQYQCAWMNCSVCVLVLLREREIWARGIQAGAMTAGLGSSNQGGGKEWWQDEVLIVALSTRKKESIWMTKKKSISSRNRPVFASAFWLFNCEAMGSFMFLASPLVSLARRYFNMPYESLHQNHCELIHVHKACECVCVCMEEEDEVCFGKGFEGANVCRIGGDKTCEREREGRWGCYESCEDHL